MTMDKKTIILIALCVLFLILYRPFLQWAGFGRYLEPQRPAHAPADSARRDSSANALPRAAPSSGAPTPAAEQPSPSTTAAPVRPLHPALERTFELETELYRATFTNRGARLLSVELKRYASAHGVSSIGPKPKHYRHGEPVPPGDRVVLAGGPLFGIDLGSNDALKTLAGVVFSASESLDAAGARRVLTFRAQDSTGLSIRQTFRVRPDDYALDLEVEIKGLPLAWRLPDYSLTLRSWPLLTEADPASDGRGLRATSLVGSNVHREHAGGLLKGPRSFEGNAAWAVVQSRYFVSGVAVVKGTPRGTRSSAERRPLPREVVARLPQGTRPDQEVVINSLAVGLPAELSPVHRFVLYAGPCEYFRLAALHVHLERAVDLGWGWLLPFSKALLQILNWVYTVIRNYGIAIIVLATLVRVLLHPLNMASMKSMRAMQRLQPELERIKEKYKSDAQAMNAAVMALYKENKVNPAGGCLPMLVQAPLFIALYQVLFNAIELRQAPFVGWMRDLSAPDLLFSLEGFPIRLLPLLMLGSGLLSQRMTPSDPRQLPTMYMMNVMMLVFFYNLPSGLVLYWTVMNVLTALQQWLVLRHDGTPAVMPQPAAAGTARRRTGAR